MNTTCYIWHQNPKIPLLCCGITGYENHEEQLWYRAWFCGQLALMATRAVRAKCCRQQQQPSIGPCVYSGHPFPIRSDPKH